MGRFLLGLLLATACWWVWQNFYADAAEKAPGSVRELTSGDLAAAGVPVAASAPRGERVDALRTQSRADPAPDAGAPDERVDARPSAEPLTVGKALRRLTEHGEDPNAIAVLEAMLDASGPAEWIAQLHAEPAFLASEAGRAVAVRAARALDGVAEADRIALSTKLAEACMHGRIEAGDRSVIELVDAIRAQHRQRVDRLLLVPSNAARAYTYRVESRDSLDGIARRFRKQQGVAIEGAGLGLLNGVSDPRRLRVGQVLRVPVDPIRAVVHRSSFLLGIYVGDDLIRTYWIAHGKPGHETPAATFEVVEKVREPDWYRSDGQVVPYGHEDNPLGTHFVKFAHPRYPGFGVHGTWDPESIRRRASLGCIRLTNEEIAEVFALLPRGAPFEVR